MYKLSVLGELTDNDLQVLVEVLQEQVMRNQERIETLHIDSAFVKGFPEFALGLRAHYELNNSHCYRLMRIIKKCRTD